MPFYCGVISVDRSFYLFCIWLFPDLCAVLWCVSATTTTSQSRLFCSLGPTWPTCGRSPQQSPIISQKLAPRISHTPHLWTLFCCIESSHAQAACTSPRPWEPDWKEGSSLTASEWEAVFRKELFRMSCVGGWLAWEPASCNKNNRQNCVNWDWYEDILIRRRTIFGRGTQREGRQGHWGWYWRPRGDRHWVWAQQTPWDSCGRASSLSIPTPHFAPVHTLIQPVSFFVLGPQRRFELASSLRFLCVTNFIGFPLQWTPCVVGEGCLRGEGNCWVFRSAWENMYSFDIAA